MNLANQSLGLSLGIIIAEFYAPLKSTCMHYSSMGRNEVDAAAKFCTVLATSQTLEVCQGSYGG